jgi:hypothetical protein
LKTNFKRIIMTNELLLSFLFCFNAISNEKVINKIDYEVNTIGTCELDFFIYLKTDSIESIHRHYLKTQGFSNVFTIRNVITDDLLDSGKIETSGGLPGNSFLKFRMANVEKERIQKLIENKSQYYIQIKHDLPIALEKDSADTFVTTRIITITPKELKDSSAGKIVVEETDADLLIQKAGSSSFLYENKFDLAQKVGNDSGTNNFVLSFKYHSQLLDFWNISFSGILSTQKNDPLNKITICPFYYSKLNWNDKFPVEYIGQVNYEGDQNFNIQKGTVSAAIQGLIPNVVNLSGSENRLRLRPVLKAGFKGIIDLVHSDNRDAQAFIEGYYYIPVLKSYALIFDGNMFNNIKATTGWHYYYSATFGAEIPNTEFKVIAKYSKGENDINFQKNEEWLIGLLYDLVK